jgi:hypothetical protein
MIDQPVTSSDDLCFLQCQLCKRFGLEISVRVLSEFANTTTEKSELLKFEHAGSNPASCALRACMHHVHGWDCRIKKSNGEPFDLCPQCKRFA